MIAVRKSSGLLVRPAPRSRELEGASSGHHGALARLTALTLVLSIFVTLDGSGHPADIGNAFLLQARVSALQQRWTQMVADGAPESDLAELRGEVTDAESRIVLGLPLTFFWSDPRALVDGWEAKTDSIWRSNMVFARASATVAERKVHSLLPAEPAEQRKGRLEALEWASTPAQLFALHDEWTLESTLIPIDRGVAAAVATLDGLVEQARSLGIRFDSAAGVLTRAAAYSLLSDPDRQLQAGAVMRPLRAAAADFSARVSAAKLAKQAFKKANDEIAIAAGYGVSTASYQGQIDADSRAYVAATSAAQLDAVARDLAKIEAGLKHEIDVWMSQVHVISGVAMYYQSHALSCEEAATSMALTHQGIHLSQDQILAEIGADRRPMYRDASGRVRWGNPYVSFVGSVDGSETNYTGFQANYPALVRVARAHGARILAYGYMTAATIYARVAAGHPVVAWATWDWAWHPRHDYLSFDGQWIPWIGPTYESHVYTIVGVRQDAVLVNDPLRGQYWVGKASFQAAYSDFMEAIVFE